MNALRRSKAANKRLMGAPGAFVGRVKQRGNNSMVLCYDAKKPLYPPREGQGLSEITISVQDIPFIKKMELTSAPVYDKHETVNYTSTEHRAEAPEVFRREARPEETSDKVDSGQQPAGVLSQIKLWFRGWGK